MALKQPSNTVSCHNLSPSWRTWVNSTTKMHVWKCIFYLELCIVDMSHRSLSSSSFNAQYLSNSLNIVISQMANDNQALTQSIRLMLMRHIKYICVIHPVLFFPVFFVVMSRFHPVIFKQILHIFNTIFLYEYF